MHRDSKGSNPMSINQSNSKIGVHFQVTLERKYGKSKSRKTRFVRNTVYDVNVTFSVNESVTFIWLPVGITQYYDLVLV